MLAGGALIARRSEATISAETIKRPMRGSFMILHTPFTQAGAVDWDDLAREAAFADRCGANGIVWPQGSSSVATLTNEERLRGMEVLAKAAKGARSALVLGVQGVDTGQMLEFAKAAEALTPDAMIAMPPSKATSLDEYRAYFRALAGATSRPVILQTSGGAPALVPPTEMIVDFAREFPHLGYVKEESEPLVPRLQAELARRDVMKGVFCANLGANWLYAMRLGVDGVITGNAMYADLFTTIWKLHEQKRATELRDAYGKFLLMRNLNELVPGADLYIMKKRGVFKTTAVRKRRPAPGQQPEMLERSFSPSAIEEIEYRFAALEPYLTGGT
jgi:4-hydroxy-tetrahydrodipicolinate synthase